MYLVDVDHTRATQRGSFGLYAIGDLHADRLDFDEDRFVAWRDQIVGDKTAVALFVGDLLEGRIPGRKHFDPDSVRRDFLDHLRTYVNHGLDVLESYFRPIVRAKVPLILVSGNHDEYLEEVGLTAALAQRLGRGAHYLGGEGFVRVRSAARAQATPTTVVYATHGTGGGKTPGPKVNAMQRTYEWIDADVVIAGHVHDGDIRIVPSYGIQRKGDLRLVRRPRVMYRAPSFVRRAIPYVVGYQGRKSYPSSDEGLMWVHVDPMGHRATRHELDLAL